MKLVDVYADLQGALPVLYQLLKEREPNQSISHKMLPGWDGHEMFVEDRPYAHWYIVEVDGYARGAVYLTHQREIGVGILKGQRGHKYGFDAVAQLMRLHPGRFLANINPANEASIALFRKLGFGPEPIQHTYARESE